jgi:hypothetical protein
MAWRPHGRVRVSARQPEAAGICDRCGFCYSHSDLRWQYDWAGERLQNLRILVCRHCEDEFQEQLRARILSPDPVPVWNARPEPFAPTGVSPDETDYFVTEGIDWFVLTTESGVNLIRENEPLGS